MSDERQPPTRAAVYVRMSHDRAGDGDGVERQQQDCLDLIDRRGWTLALPPFIDNHRSAAGRKPRPSFLALLTAILDDQLDAIVAWSFDRLARTARDRLALVDACRDHKVTIALVRGSDMDPTTPGGRLAIGVLGEVAAHEIEQKADRQRRAAEQAAEAGKWIGGRKPFGYEPDGVTVVKDEADAIRDAYNAVLAGDTLRSIAARWSAAGFTTGQAPYRRTHLGDRSPWRTSTVRRVLMNPRYAGLRQYRGEERGQAVWPALVDEATYRAAVRVLTDESRHTRGAGMAARQLLTGIAYCAVAGCELTVHGGGASHRKPIYRCRSSIREAGDRARSPVAPGTHTNRLAEPVDDYVTDLVIERLSRADARNLLVVEDRPDVPKLRDRAHMLRRRLDSMAAEFADDPEVTAAEYRVMTGRVREQLAEIEEQIADAGRVDILGELITASNVRAVWLRLSRDRQRAVIKTLMTIKLHAVGRGTRTFRPDTVEVIWKTT